MSARPAARWLWLLPEARQALESRELAVILRCYRRLTGLSQAAMGELLGYDPSYISLLERRQRTIGDRQGLAHISRVLSIPPHALGISTEEDADFLAALQFGESTVRLAEIARQAGRAAEAVEELWPLVARLEARLKEGLVDHGTASLLARARATLGTSLGHVLAEERLYLAAYWTGQAMRLARHLDNSSFLGHTLRMHGNELRKAGRHGAAIARLTEAAELSHETQERGQTLILLARAAGEQGNTELHDGSVAASERLMDEAGPSGILFTSFSLREVRMRGLLETGRTAAAAKLAQSRPGPGEAPAPQWAAIEAVTSADALSAAGDLTSAHALYDEALSLAARHRLPHQVQRVVRSVRIREFEGIRARARTELENLHRHGAPIGAFPGVSGR
ncbi:helix-turn-helix domain-containing protein [Nocardiopsis changdeensis]|uniref:Helix-turn-helix domain-containing protein n=1 Tax=Nocardiopsis changdeensis TaxID=2831969 RepID=A0ABX8BSV1_9ACTN|nr:MULTISPECIES: helix-turn-helix domain-containing protein [Nocardiopsis]QUX25186.1 helix-turn-helix domain-containing protein [Nocardiopsis changdeensis]QYX35573.1 helix-turn-helix domain-containing protein [Nocardiopsis sp. MT53]